MSGAFLALVVCLGQVPAVDPGELVSRLGAPRYAEREEAASALERLGRLALPALRSTRDLRDPEIRTRAAALLNKIEGMLLTQPTLVTLNFDHAPLGEVLKALGEQSGIKLVLVPENSPQWARRTVTLNDPDPVPFWKAVDRLCEAARLQYNSGVQGYPSGREPSLALFDGAMRLSNPISDTGPFRVMIAQLHLQRDVNFPPGDVGGNPPPPAVNEQFFAQIQVSGEPRLTLGQSGAIRVTEALDDKSHSLVAANMVGSALRASGYFGFSNGSVIQLQVPLAHPTGVGGTIRTLKGVIPVVVSTRKPNPLVVPLNPTSVNRSFQNDDVVITLHEIRRVPNSQQTALDLSIRPSTGAHGNNASTGGIDAVQRPDGHHQQQIEITDGPRRGIPWYQTSFDADTGRLTLTLTASDPATHALELRYFNLVRASAEVPFEFNNVRMP